MMNTISKLAETIINAPLPVPSEANGTYDELRESGALRSDPVPPNKTGGYGLVPPKPAAGKVAKLPIPPRRVAPEKPKAKKATVTAPAAESAPAATTSAPDCLDIPAALKRGKETPEQAAARRAKFAKTDGPDRKIKNPPNVKQAKAKAAKRGDGPTKNELVVALLTRPEGCTAEDARKATGWESVSVSKQATIAGIKLKKVKEDGVTRYWAK